MPDPNNLVYPVTSMYKQGVPPEQIMQQFNLIDKEHLLTILRNGGICISCEGL